MKMKQYVCFTLKRLSLDYEICTLTCTNSILSILPPLRVQVLTTKDVRFFSFFFFADCILTDGIILLMI